MRVEEVCVASLMLGQNCYTIKPHVPCFAAGRAAEGRAWWVKVFVNLTSWFGTPYEVQEKGKKTCQNCASLRSAGKGTEACPINPH